MCGIVGYKPLEPHEGQREAFQRLFTESCIRGLHAYGLADERGAFRAFSPDAIPAGFRADLTTIAHARYCQSGDWRVLENNQPIVVGNMALAMNGVISMGTKSEFEAEFGVSCTVDNDSEVFLRKIEDAHSPEDIIRKADGFIGAISGSFAATLLVDDLLFAGHNPRRPLWRCMAYGAKWYASTEDIFRRAGFTGAEPVRVGFEQA